MAYDLTDKAEALVRECLRDGGCACRFARFRCVVKRDTAGALGISCRGEDQIALIAAFERISPLGERRALGGYAAAVEGMWEANCLRCSSGVERSSHECVSGGWADYLTIRRAPGLLELGADVDQPFRCRPLVALGPESFNPGVAARIYPCIDDDAWFAWLRARC